MAYFADFSRIEAKLKHKARAGLKAKKRAFQLREQQLTDMIVQDGAFNHQFVKIEDLLRAGASDAAFQNELNEFYDLFSAKKIPEKDNPIYGDDKEALHYLGGNLMKELDIAENEDKLPRRLSEATNDSVDELSVLSVTVVECAGCGEAHEITSCALSPFDDASEVSDSDLEDSINSWFDILSDFKFTDAIISRDIFVGPPAELAADGEISPLTLDLFTLDRQLPDGYECSRKRKRGLRQFCRFMNKDGDAFEWNVLLYGDAGRCLFSLYYIRSR